TTIPMMTRLDLIFDFHIFSNTLVSTTTNVEMTTYMLQNFRMELTRFNIQGKIIKNSISSTSNTKHQYFCHRLACF
ncbi:MAG: hypothetical protein WAM14_03950, partial [Candidatus Nitrosopolaris sp.]